MAHENPTSENQSYLQNPSNGEPFEIRRSQCSSEEIDSACSTPYVSAPSSPGRCPSGSRYFFSAPASPMHLVLSSSSSSSSGGFVSSSPDRSVSGAFEFEFSARLSSNSSNGGGSMSSADELFLNGQIRPMKLSSHLQRPHVLAPLTDLDVEEEEEEEEDEERKDLRGKKLMKREESMVRGRDLRLRDRSLHRRTRSLSPLRSVNAPFQWRDDEGRRESVIVEIDCEMEVDSEMPSVEEAMPSVSASSSRSSSAGRSSKRWVFLKDFLRSKSEGRGNAKEKFWYAALSFSPAKDNKKASSSSSKEKKPPTSSSSTETQKSQRLNQIPAKKTSVANPANGGGKRRTRQSPHELHYTANRAQAEEMKKRTFLPYRQGLLGCLGFSSESFGAMNGFARALNPVSSR